MSGHRRRHSAGVQIGVYRLVRESALAAWRDWLRSASTGSSIATVALKLRTCISWRPVASGSTRGATSSARLSHPKHAALYDAGLTATGRPYLALEHVDGEPITQWSREHRAPLVQRLDLMRQVMAAVDTRTRGSSSTAT